MLRPMGPFTIQGAASNITPDHPNFTGSNPAGSFDAVNGPWDVDNDGDGIPDSVWIDVGMPVQTAPDGRQFKVLAAPLVLDLDGRINVNAHGNVAQISGYTPASTIPANYYASGTVPTVLPGQGYGPAEIYLSPPGSTYGISTTQLPSCFRLGIPKRIPL